MIPGIVASRRRGGSTPPTGDPHWDNVVVLLDFEAAAGSQSVINRKDNGITFSALSPADLIQISDSEKKFGDTSLLMQNQSDVNAGSGRLVSSESSFLQLTGDYTIEFFIMLNTAPTEGRYLFGWSAGQYAEISAGRCISFVAATPVVATLPLGEWAHVAICRESGSTKIFLNGTLIDSTNYHTLSGGNKIYFGTYSYGLNFGPNCYLDEFRITNGVARYSGNFNPPTEPFPTFGV